MKLFFNASLHGKPEFRKHYEKLYELINKTGHKVIGAPVMDVEAEQLIGGSPKEASDYFKKLLKWIKQADILIFEVSFPSTSIGYEIALAIQHSKPVIACRIDKAAQNVVLGSMSDERLQLIDYRLGDLQHLVADSIEYAAQQQDTRFNFFISPQIAEHLDWVSKEKRLPRAVYLRKLTEDHMEENQEYEG